MKFQLRVTFVVGTLIGLSIALVTLVLFEGHDRSMAAVPLLGSAESFDRWLYSEHLKISKDHVSESVSIAQYLYDLVHVSCVVLSSKQRQARAIVGTWGRHCNSLSFVANFEDKYVAVGVKTSLDDDQLVCKTLLNLVRNGFGGTGTTNEWLFLTDDTTFAIIENLRYLLAPLNSSDVHYFGHAVKKLSSLRGIDLVVNVLAGGIVLSQGAVVDLLLSLDPDCRGAITRRSSFEDTIASYLLKSYVARMDTRDLEGSARFLARPLEKLLIEKNMSPYDDFMKDSVFRPQLGAGCCSSQAVSVHRVDALDMHFYEYLLYRLLATGKRLESKVPLRSVDIPPVNSDGDAAFWPAEPRGS